LRELGDAWTAGMHPEIPETKILDNPYVDTEWDAGTARCKKREEAR
jgi:5-methylthioadenosine/S-adenosylhomocysteine deaminase